MAPTADNGASVWRELSEQQTRPKRGIFILVDGDEGTGKTSLALTLAKLGTIAYVDIDQSIDRAQRPTMPKGKKFSAKVIPVRYNIAMNEAKNKASCLPAWKGARAATLEAAKSWANTVIVDTGDEMWDVLRFGAFGTLTPKGLIKNLYGPVNGAFRQWIRTIHRHNMRHLVFTNKMREQWAKGADGVDAPTGKKERIGFREVGYLADMAVRTIKVKGEFKVKVTLCKLAPNGPALEGQVFEGEEADLVHILCLATATEPSDWSK